MEQVKKSSIKPQHVIWIFVGFGVIAWFNEQNKMAEYELNQVETRLQLKKAEVAKMERSRKEKILEIKGLQSDPFIIEKRLREATGKMRDNEIPPEEVGTIQDASDGN